MNKIKFIMNLRLKYFMLLIIFLPGLSISQQLSQDPLYRLVFEDNFDSIDYNKWNTSWPWGNNLWNSNYTIACDSELFPNRIVDIAYNSQPPNDYNRSTINSSGVTYERLIFDREYLYDNIIVYHTPCDSPICENHTCDTNIYGEIYCYYDSAVPFKFSGAMLMGKTRFKYGYIEMRYNLSYVLPSNDNAYGPNLWMWAADTDAFYSEIDVFEQRGTDWRMEMNFHCRKKDPDSSNVWADTVMWSALGDSMTLTTPYPKIIGESDQYIGGTWHTVGCEWTPDHIDNYYDSDDTIRRFSDVKLPIDNLTAMPLVIDLYMPAVQYCIPFDTLLTYKPFFYEIDYVRVYQINQACGCDTTSGYFPSFPSNQYNSMLYRDLTIGGGGSAILNNGSYHLAGEDYVILQNGFEVSGTANVIISTPLCQPDQTMIVNTTSNSHELPKASILREILNNKQDW